MRPLLDNLIKFILFPWYRIVSSYHCLINWLYQPSACVHSCCWLAAVHATIFFCTIVSKIVCLIRKVWHQWYGPFFIILKPVCFSFGRLLRFLCKSRTIDFSLDLIRCQYLLVFRADISLLGLCIFLNIIMQCLIIEILVFPVVREHLYFLKII